MNDSAEVKALLQAAMDAYDPETLGDDPDPAEFDSWQLLYDAKAALEASQQAPAVDREALFRAMYQDVELTAGQIEKDIFVNAIITSGVLQDAAVVRAEEQEWAARVAEHYSPGYSKHPHDAVIARTKAAIAQAIREGRAHE